MKKVTLLFMALLVAGNIAAKNLTQRVTQVTEAVTVTDNVDYHINSSDPFTTTGSINLVNTDHAVLIFDNVKPSVVTSSYLPFIFINGEKAVANYNCEIRIYAQGTIVLPYGKTTHLLTTYTENGEKGDSCTDYSTGSDNGVMKTLDDEHLNNRIASFKLKRGYMVTFSLQAAGKGYSRCFIAADEDLSVDLPVLMSGRVSSYRLFKWIDTDKKGLANDLSASNNSLLNSTWAYSFGNGVGTNPSLDTEGVSFKMHEGWPGNGEDGISISGNSANLKTNNEPANKSDDNPATVDQVLANWEKYMATGKRLCSPCPHDGGETWLRQFMDSIDARGWRCDVVDVHCYWYGNVNNWKSWMSSKGYESYGRPIWISEFLYGASWSGNWYANTDNSSSWSSQYSTNLNAMKPVLEWMNSFDQIERYAYWNGEKRGSRIINTSDSNLKNKGYLTPLGEYYAKMTTGLAYNGKYEFVPTTPKQKNPVINSYSFTPSTKVFAIKYTDANGELAKQTVLERKKDNGDWEEINVQPGTDGVTNFTYNDTIKEGGNYTYRVKSVYFSGSVRYTTSVYNVINPTSGNDSIQYGSMTLNNDEVCYNMLQTTMTEQPSVVFGSPTNNNPNLAPVERVERFYKTGKDYSIFTAGYYPWTVSTKQKFYKAETSNFIAAKPGNGTIGDLAYETGLIHTTTGATKAVGSDPFTFTFDKAFDEAPVVFVTPFYLSGDYPQMWRVSDVTPTGFTLQTKRQQSLDNDKAKTANTRFFYFAIQRGQTKDNEGRLIIADTVSGTWTSPTGYQTFQYTDGKVKSPKLMAQLQTTNRNLPVVLRLPETDSETSFRVRILLDETCDSAFGLNTPMHETVGYMVIGEDTTFTTGITPATINPARGDVRLTVALGESALGVTDAGATVARVYSTNGLLLSERSMIQGQTTIDISNLPKGVYIVRTDARHAAKFVKR